MTVTKRKQAVEMLEESSLTSNTYKMTYKLRPINALERKQIWRGWLIMKAHECLNYTKEFFYYKTLFYRFLLPFI